MTPASTRPALVSCVMIFLNGARFIDDAIRSVVGQTGFDDWELILVDDGSTDESTALAKAWAAKQPSRIRYVDHPGHQNLGMSAARNLGVRHAVGRYIAFLDCDDVFLPSSLAHRMRVAAAHPDADLVLGGTWWWHSWTGEESAAALECPLYLPVAPTLTTLPAPQLFAGIFGIPGGSHVSAICGLLIRRDALLAIGGMEEQFRGLYEDQVLWAKVGLKLSAVVDPRPLALYRQHADSACSVSLATGAWTRTGPSPPLAQFHAWLQEYTRQEMGEDSPEWQIVQRNIAHALDDGAARDRGLRGLVKRFAPEFVKRAVRRLRDRSRHDAVGDRPISIPAMWSEQFLRVITTSMSGRVLVVAPSLPTDDEPWRSELPEDAFGPSVQRTVCPADRLEGSVRFDHVVVPFETSLELSARDVLDVLQRCVRPGGTVAAVLPGRAWFAPNDGVVADRGELAREVERAARERFPEMHVSVETFGNAVTAAAVARQVPASEVRGVAIDHHDSSAEVLLGLVISAPLTSGPGLRADRAARPGGLG